MMRNAVTGEEIPPRVDPTLFYQLVLEGALADIVFKSRCSTWMREHPGSDALDFLWAVLAPARNGDNPLRFTSVSNAVAFVLAQPSPPLQWKDQT